MADISKILIPALDGTPGGIYNIKDTVARSMLAGGVNHRIVWDGNSVPTVANIPNTVSIRYNDNVYVGTLSVNNAETMTFYLVAEGDGGDRFAEYVVATDPTTGDKQWEKIGYTGEGLSNLGALAYMDTIDITKGLGANVIGENATLTASSSSVSFGAHSTSNVLPSNTTFSFTDPVFGLSLTKGNIQITRSTNTALLTTPINVLSALDDSQSRKGSFLTSGTKFTRKKIGTASVRGVGANTTSTSVNFGSSTKHKLITDTVVPAASKTVNGNDLVKPTQKKLATTQIRGVNGTEAVKGVTTVDSSLLATDTINKVSQITQNNAQNSEWKDTIANLDIHMYSSVTDGTIQGADTETLVISFKTMPSLKINSSTTYATGSFAGENSVASVVTGVNTSNYTLATAASDQTTVATGSVINLSETGGATVVTSLSYDNVTVAEQGTAKRFATGAISLSNTQDNSETQGDYVYTNMAGTVDVPTIDNSTTAVLTPSLLNATNVNGDVNVLTDVDTDTGNAYTDIQFETTPVVSSVSVGTQPEFGASVTSNDNGQVVIGGQINKTSSGSVSVANGVTPVSAITALGAGTAAAQTITWDNKDLKKVALYDDVNVQTEAHPTSRYLNFVTPNGGTVSLVKNGSPYATELEYSLDGVNWQTWEIDSETGNRTKTLAAGERFYLRNKSVTSTRFSKDGVQTSDYYQFTLPNNTEVNGILESLVCRTPEYGKLSSGCFKALFLNQVIKGNVKSISTAIPSTAFYRLFDCGDITGGSKLTSVTISVSDANNLGADALTRWMSSIQGGGVLYCPASLELPSGSSGLRTDWTREDL